MKVTVFAAALALGLPATAIAQADQTPTEKYLSIFEGDKCPADTICVIAPESERYRIPKSFRQGVPKPSTQSWAVRSRETVSEGKAGPGSCSNVGGAGWRGCWDQYMREAREEAKARAEGQKVP